MFTKCGASSKKGVLVRRGKLPRTILDDPGLSPITYLVVDTYLILRSQDRDTVHTLLDPPETSLNNRILVGPLGRLLYAGANNQRNDGHQNKILGLSRWGGEKLSTFH